MSAIITTVSAPSFDLNSADEHLLRGFLGKVTLPGNLHRWPSRIKQKFVC